MSEIDSTPFKRCTTCGNEKPATSDFFCVQNNKPKARCRTCDAEYTREYYRTHRAQRLKYNMAWNAEHREEVLKRANVRSKQRYAANPEEHKARAKLWRDANPERKHQNDKQWREKNKERKRENGRRWNAANKERLSQRNHEKYMDNPQAVRERSDEWRKNNPEKLRAQGHNRRAREKNAEGSHTGDDIQAQYKRQHGKCYYCHEHAERDDKPYNVDHVIPLDRGGSNGPENIVIACYKCNSSKRNKLPHEWAKGGRLL